MSEEAKKREEKAAKEAIAKKSGKKASSPSNNNKASPGGGGEESRVQHKQDAEWIGYTYKNFEVVGDEVKKKVAARPSMSSVFHSP